MRASRTRTSGLGLVLAAAMLSSLCGCGLLDLDRPRARITGVKLQDVRLDSAVLLVDVELENPYSAPLPLANLDYRLASKGEVFLSGKADLQGAVPAKGSKIVSFPARFTYAKVLKALRSVRPGQVVPYEVELGLSVNVPGAGTLRLPLRHTGKLPIPAAPGAAIEEIIWDDVNLDSISGKVRLRISNRNSFALDLKSLSVHLTLGGVGIAELATDRPVHFDAGGDGVVDLHLAFSPKRLGLAAFRMLTGKGASYGIKGTLKARSPFGPMDLGVDDAGKTVFRKP